MGGWGAPRRTFISDSRFTCSTWKASCSFTRATSSWLCCVTVSCLAVSAFCTDGPDQFGSGSAALGAPLPPLRVRAYLPEQLGVRVDELIVLFLQLVVACLRSAGLLCGGERGRGRDPPTQEQLPPSAPPPGPPTYSRPPRAAPGSARPPLGRRAAGPARGGAARCPPAPSASASAAPPARLPTRSPDPSAAR